MLPFFFDRLQGDSMSKLYVVSTPIGNLQDVSLRALEILRNVDLIACEDTRETRKLLNRHGIRGRTTSYHDHNKETRTPQLIKKILGGSEIALVSDRGTPGISDPGFVLVRSAIDHGIEVVPVPGSSSILASLVVSGLPTDRFLFIGFLPKRKNPRKKILDEVKSVRATLIMYISPRAVMGTLAEMSEILGDRNAVLVREVTKLNEEVLRGKLSELERVLSFRKGGLLGEFVLLVEGTAGHEHTVESDPVIEALFTKPPESVKEGVSWLVENLGVRKNRAYEKVSDFISRGDPPRKKQKPFPG